MASSREFVDYVVEQLSGAGEIRYRAMFGEYGLYLDGKFFAMVCDNQLLFKDTEAGRRAGACAGGALSRGEALPGGGQSGRPGEAYAIGPGNLRRAAAAEAEEAKGGEEGWRLILKRRTANSICRPGNRG